MKDFIRDNRLLSLCGLNCGLCSMNLGGYCPGGGGGAGNQSCKTAKCSLQHGKVEYCNKCENFPCEKYEGIEETDSFITHRNRMKDLKKVEKIGTEAYRAEQDGKIRILKILLEKFNDGRNKTFFCLSVNLLELSDLKMLLAHINKDKGLENLSSKDQTSYVVKLIQDVADQRQITLKMRKKRRRYSNEPPIYSKYLHRLDQDS